ncbi:MAG TPA: GDSL-type esterase/lipase family protein [Candidatus Baltobacteraceae bacterium]|nr:GDSL-type esterase/lipase family protein [Candidatus Baltobacteraceae bacterium]
MLQPAPPPAIVSRACAPNGSASPAPARPFGSPSATPIASPAPSSPLPSSAAPSPAPARGPAIPAIRPWGTAAWLAQHERFSACAHEGGIDAIFLGDSIAAFFPVRGAGVWSREIAPLGNIVDFGIEGDRTQFVLWRVLHGELDGSGARAVVLMVGTNNLAVATPDAIARGIAAIVAAIRERLPDACVLVSGILPRGAPDDPRRAKADAVNARIAALADGDRVRYVDAGAGFVAPDGTIPSALMPDGLHPSEAGYEVWAAALAPALRELLGK